MHLRAPLAVGAVLLLAASAGAGDGFRPDPASVRRYGPAYRYPQAGWTVLHVEGEPFDRGYQHGRLMAPEIAAYVRTLALQQSAKAPADGWRLTRTLVGAAFLRKFDSEYLEEMKGIADGAAAAGASFDSRPIDLVDIAAVNLVCEYDTLDAALAAQPTGLEGIRFPRPPAPRGDPPAQKDHCSAFAATGPATADGKMVIGHITMSGLPNANFSNVWLDVQPARGHRVVMQSYPGGIQSMMDYYITAAGLVLTETTISQTRFDPDGTPLAGRVRKAVQYGATIDDVAAALTRKNNGLYTNEWLIGDANTNEIAILELGTTAHRLRRSSKGEWLMAGVEGFYWGCNNTKDLAVRLDTLPGLNDRPHDASWRPSNRDKAWLRMYQKHRGTIDAAFGKLAFATPPLSAHPSLDAKVTTTDLAKRLESHALFGPPYGKVWVPTFQDRTTDPDIRALVPNDWAVLTPAGPPPTAPVKAADIADRVGGGAAVPAPDPPTAPAWHGTLLARADADLWVTAGFAAYERVVALETALRDRSGGRLTAADRDRVELAVFRFRADYRAAKAARPGWRTGGDPPGPVETELDRDRWHQEQTGYGVLALHAVRGFVGDKPFAGAMDEFGRAHAGKEVTAAAFTAFVGKQTGKDVAGFLTRWAADPAPGGATFSTTHWLADPENAVIVYGTRAEAAANEAAARRVQEAVRTRWTNVTIPVIPDRDAGEAALRGRHVILVGRPATSAAAERYRAAFPVVLGPASATVGDTVYAHEGTAVIAAGVNPVDGRFSAVLLAGLSAESTYRAADALVRQERPAEVSIIPAGAAVRQLVVGQPAAAEKAVSADR
ncbi:MAG: hypothetical protein JWO38_3355 [Gemmataceae bacterium]|nr:hypothetical protein [Gemmataceae bacterium]